MQTFSNTKKSEAQHENSFAHKSINSSPCAAARKGTQALKSQTSKKGRAHTTIRSNELAAPNLKTNALVASKKYYPCLFMAATLTAQPIKSRKSHNQERTGPQHS